MKVKVNELNGKALDWAVAKAINAEKITINDDKAITVDVGHTKYCDSWSPSSDWEQIGPLVDRYRIDFDCHGLEVWARPWVAIDLHRPEAQGYQIGPNHRVAACRAIVAAFLCDRKSNSVKVPEDLL